MINKKKKLLHVTSSLKVGGAEAILCDLVRGLGNDYIEHTVIYFHDGPRAQDLQDLGVKLFQVSGAVSLYDPVFFFRLFKLINQLNPNVIHSLLWSANVASRVIAKMLSIKHVSVYHNNIDQDGCFRNLLDGMTRGFSTRLVAVSDEVADSIQKKYNSISASRLMVIKNGIDAISIRKKGRDQAVVRAELGLDDDHFIVGSVGRFCPVKNYPLLLKSFTLLYNRNSKARLVLIGIGPEEQNLRNLARKLGVANNVIFIVGQPAYGYFSLFDCFVQSSDKEGISIALLEAISFGVPCIVTNVQSAHPVIVSGETGILVPAGDENELFEAINRLLDDRAARDRFGLAGKEYVERELHLKGMIERYRAVFFDF